MENVLAIVWSILLTLGIMSIGGDAGTSSVSGSFFEVADVVFDLDQLPSDYKEVASIIHCACLTHFADATAEGFVYFTDDQKCWTSIQQSTNPGVGVTLQVGKRKVNIPKNFRKASP